MEELYRGIMPDRVGFYSHLFDSGVIRQLVNQKFLIESEPVDLSLQGFGLIVKHPRLSFVSYPFEWCAPMLKEAALLVLDLEMALFEHGLGLQDCHPWNVLFEATKPLFVDFGSIVTANGNNLWESNGEFFRYFVYPLLAMASGQTRIARWLLHDYTCGISEVEADFLTRRRGSQVKERTRKVLRSFGKRYPGRLHFALRKGLRLLDRVFSGRAPRLHESRIVYLRRLRTMVESIVIPRVPTGWSNYYDSDFPQFHPSGDWQQKHSSVHKVITNLKPRTLIDIGANRGWHSLMAAHFGVNTIAADIDEECISQLFYDARERDLPVQPLVLDFTSPSPGLGISNNMLPSATQRLKSEMALALALVHHMVFKSNLTFDQITQGLSDFTTKYLLVEFIPKEDRYVKEWWTPAKSWYSLDEFQRSLRRHYSSVTLLESYPEPRVLLLCEKQ